MANGGQLKRDGIEAHEEGNVPSGGKLITVRNETAVKYF